MTEAMAVRDQHLTRYELEVEDVIAQVQKIQRVMEAVMKEGEHYGKIPGTDKPTLLKPGAEKLCLTFRLDPQYVAVHIEDGKHLTVTSTCTLWHIASGQRMGSGMGSCSTKESKYAYRHAKRKCPKCGAEQINRSKFPKRGAEPGYYCHAKFGGCGAEFAADDQAIIGQIIGRVANEDLADTYNTILKMANKRALVAAVLNVTAASDIFTQDLEDTDGRDEGRSHGEAAGRGESARELFAERGHEDPASIPGPTASAATQRAPQRQGAAEITVPSSIPGDPARPMTDPETHRGESERLFPPVESEERAALMAKIGKMTESRRKVLKQRLLGDAEADLSKRDVAELKLLADQA